MSLSQVNVMPLHIVVDSSFEYSASVVLARDTLNSRYRQDSGTRYICAYNLILSIMCYKHVCHEVCQNFAPEHGIVVCQVA